STAKSIFKDCNIRTKAMVTRLQRSSNDPAHPTQNNTSGSLPCAASSAIVGIFISCESTLLSFQISIPLRPIKTIRRRALPEREVAPHNCKLGITCPGQPGFFHCNVPTDFKYEFQRIDQHRPRFHARVASGTGIDLFAGDVVAKECLSIIKTRTAFGKTRRNILHTVACIHHDLSWRQRLPCKICGAFVSAATAFGARVGAQQMYTRKVVNILCSESSRFRCGWGFAEPQH